MRSYVDREAFVVKEASADKEVRVEIEDKML